MSATTTPLRTKNKSCGLTVLDYPAQDTLCAVAATTPSLNASSMLCMKWAFSRKI